MFEVMLIVTALIALGGAAIAYDGSRDVFHPLIFIGPMMAFLYGWMPWKLYQRGGLDRFFTSDQLFLVQTLYLLGVLAFVGCCLTVGVRLKGRKAQVHTLPKEVCRRILTGAMIVGSLGFVCWIIAIQNVGGFSQAFSGAYGGGYDTSGYIRDGAMLLLVGVLLAITSLSAGGPKVLSLATAVFFGSPWLANAVLMGRRGPTFMLAVFVLMGWFINRTKRPPLLAVGAVGVCLGWLVLFLVTNRSQIYLGSQFDVKTDVSNIVETADNSNEYVYGSGAVLSARARDHFFWMRRYLAQSWCGPSPARSGRPSTRTSACPSCWSMPAPAKGFGPTLGWVGAPGLRARHHRRLVHRGQLARDPGHGPARLGLWTRLEERRAARRPVVEPVRDCLRACHLLRHADDGGSHLPHHHALAAVLADLEVRAEAAGARRCARATLGSPACCRGPRPYVPRAFPAPLDTEASERNSPCLTHGLSPCRAPASRVIWIDWYAYHVARFRGLERRAGAVG